MIGCPKNRRICLQSHQVFLLILIPQCEKIQPFFLFSCRKTATRSAVVFSNSLRLFFVLFHIHRDFFFFKQKYLFKKINKSQHTP